MKTFFLITLLILGFVRNCFPQYTMEWVARYSNLNSNDEAYKMVIDNIGNVYVTGESQLQYLTIKYNSNGQELWTQSYHGAYPLPFDIPGDIAIDTYGNIYVTGRARTNGYYTNYVTIKYDSGGNQTWVGTYDSHVNNPDAATSLVLDKNDNLYVTGYSIISDSNYNVSYNTIKYDPDGSIAWISRYFENLEYPLGGYAPYPDISVDSSGNVIMACCYGGYGGEDFHYAVIKYNSEGQQLWIKNLPSRFDISTLAADKYGNIYFAGVCEVGIIYTVKYNPDGDTLWVRKNAGSKIMKIDIDASGNVIVAGSSFQNGYLTLKYDSAGTLLWSSSDNTGYELNSMTIDDYGNIYETGNTSEIVDFYTVKFNSNGVRVWSSQYNGPGNSYDFANDIKVDYSGNIYVTGQSIGIGTNTDFATIKYSVITSSNNTSETLPVNFILYQNYPNPFNPVTHLEFGISDLGFVSLKVYNALGKEVAVLVNELLSPGSYKTEFNGTNYPSGIYYYKLEAGSFSEVRKMILLK